MMVMMITTLVRRKVTRCSFQNNKITSLPRHDDQLNGLLVRSALNVRGCFCALLVTPVTSTVVVVRPSTAAATAPYRLVGRGAD